MNTNKLKPFAQTARQIMMEGVARRVLYLGFDAKGKVVEEPMSVAGGVILRGEVIDDPTLPGKWNALRSAIQRNGFENVVEEAAYTWFNRMMAIRIMAKNNYDLPQLEYDAEGSHTPLILTRARRGIMGFLSQREKARVSPLLGDYSQEQKTFAILLTGYCHHHRLLNRIFGRLNDYTELLLPDNTLSETGFLYLLNTSDAISDEDYRKVELIGWLYQFYISEKKDQVFASFKKNKKAEAADIPAATQIFTPNWIVKYMVQNTVGRLWLDNHPESPLKEKMKYLVESPQEPSPAGNEERLELKSTDHIEIKLLDPACGSGHILVEGFYHLYDMYEEEYYMPAEAVEKILEHNLYGLDIDLRASQLAQFAVMLAAASKYPDILKSDINPHIFTMPEPDKFTSPEIREFLGSEGQQYEKVLTKALDLMQQAKNLGSVMQFTITDAEQRFFQQRFNILQSEARTSLMAQSLYNKFLPYLQIMLVLTEKYEAIAANPPYMGSKSMNSELSNYVSEYYPKSKADLMTVFMEVIPSLTIPRGRFALINLPSWLFLSSFENLRKDYLTNYHIESLLHMGRGIFGIDFGSVAFAIRKVKGRDLSGTYFRLHERNFQHIYYEDIEKLFLFSKNKPMFRYDFGQYRDVDGVTQIPPDGTQTGLELFYPNIPQSNFSKIPGSPIAFWISDNYISTFSDNINLDRKLEIKQGLATGNNDQFLRFWFEIDKSKSYLYCPSLENAHKSLKKWFPYNKGGGFRKWYGNQDFFIAFDYENYSILKNQGNHLPSKQYYFRESITWSDVSSGSFACRYSPLGFIFDVKGSSGFTDEDLFYKIAFLNSIFASSTLYVLNPTLSYQVGNIKSLPYKFDRNLSKFISLLSQNNIEIAKNDWDSHETSWNFQRSVLLHGNSNLKDTLYFWVGRITKSFYQLQANEEILNSLFLSIFNLVDEILPEVHLNNITILQEEVDFNVLDEVEAELRKRRQWRLEESKWNLYVDNELQPIPAEGELPKALVQPPLPIKKNVVMQQLISYAIGCMMGRYSLDAPGLILANQGETLDDYFEKVKSKKAKVHSEDTNPEESAYKWDKRGSFLPDEDGIIPLMGSNCGFSDDAVHRMRHFIEVVWGSETLTQNINFLQSCLDMDLEKYLVTQGNFWKDNCSRYKKKPIYWLFSSKKGAFQVLVYMHRMNRFTVQKIRDNYLLRHLQWLSNQVAQLQSRASQLNRNEAKRLDYLRAAFAECEEYDLHLKNIADQQIEFDLDDGVSVNYEKFRPVVADIK